MSLKVCVFGSGSTGNCIFVSSGSVKILVDLGLTASRVEKSLRALNETADNVKVLITHAHHDHVSGLDAFCARHPDAEVYCHADCLGSVWQKAGKVRNRLISVGGDFFIGDVTVSPFKVSHDVPCVGYGFLCGGKKITVATDTGKVSQKVMDVMSDSDLVVLESNHDETLLKNNADYSPFLKKRILSDKGHLSNADCSRCVAYLAAHGVKQVVLAHLSRENNYPELAFETCKNFLSSQGICEGRDVKLEIAFADRMSSLFEII